jgi:tetratricopeptide (TPR) repeat protein
MEYYDRAIQNDPKNATAYLWRSTSFANIGYIDRASQDTAVCLELDPFYENCRRHHALWLLVMGEEDLAMELFQQGIERSFTGTRRGFYPAIMKREGRLATALLLLTWGDRNPGYPVSDYLDAIEFPEADHSAGLERILSWMEANEKDLSNWSDMLNAFGAFDLMDPAKWDLYLVWTAEYSAYRQSPYFKPLIREQQAIDYWRENGFPPQCRPVGGEDFECD